MKKMAFVFMVMFLFLGCEKIPLDSKIQKNSIDIPDPWKPQEVWIQGLYLNFEGWGIGNDQTLSEEQFRSFLTAMKNCGIDVIEVRVWVDDIQLVVKTIQLIHEHGMKAAINFWQYPGMRQFIPVDYRGVRLDSTGTLQFGFWSDEGAGVFSIDLTNQNAVDWMMNNLENFLAQVSVQVEVDYFLIVEEKINPFHEITEWPKRIYYNDASLYSELALQNFKQFYGLHSNPRFPVHSEPLYNDKLSQLLILEKDLNDTQWQVYFDWRAQVFTDYIKRLSQVGNQYTTNGTVLMEWQRLVDEMFFNNDKNSWPPELIEFVQDNKVFGVSFEKILQEISNIELILEFGEDGAHPEEWTVDDNRRNTEIFKNLCEEYGKSNNLFLQLFGFDSKKGPVAENLIIQNWKLVLEYKPKRVVLYSAGVLWEGSWRYNTEITKLWKNLTGISQSGASN